jgi:hypothetical protein
MFEVLFKPEFSFNPKPLMWLAFCIMPFGQIIFIPYTALHCMQKIKFSTAESFCSRLSKTSAPHISEERFAYGVLRWLVRLCDHTHKFIGPTLPAGWPGIYL